MGAATIPAKVLISRDTVQSDYSIGVTPVRGKVRISAISKGSKQVPVIIYLEKDDALRLLREIAECSISN